MNRPRGGGAAPTPPAAAAAGIAAPGSRPPCSSPSSAAPTAPLPSPPSAAPSAVTDARASTCVASRASWCAGAAAGATSRAVSRIGGGCWSDGDAAAAEDDVEPSSTFGASGCFAFLPGLFAFRPLSHPSEILRASLLSGSDANAESDRTEIPSPARRRLGGGGGAGEVQVRTPLAGTASVRVGGSTARYLLCSSGGASPIRRRTGRRAARRRRRPRRRTTTIAASSYRRDPSSPEIEDMFALRPAARPALPIRAEWAFVGRSSTCESMADVLVLVVAQFDRSAFVVDIHHELFLRKLFFVYRTPSIGLTRAAARDAVAAADRRRHRIRRKFPQRA